MGPSTRAVHAGLVEGEQGAALLPGPVLAAPFHLRGPADASEYGYGRDANPTWTALELAIGALEGGEAVVFSSGMAAISALLLSAKPGEVVVLPRDGYPAVREIGLSHLKPRGVEVRFVRSRTEDVVEASAGAGLVFVETPSNPRLDVVDIRAVAAAAPDSRVVVDNTVATGLGQQPLALGASFSVSAGTKSLSGHSDVLFGVVVTRDEAAREALVEWRTQTGAILGPFEAWLAHRSLATLELRLARSSANALAIAELLAARSDVSEVCHPSFSPVALDQMRHFGALVSFDLGSEERAQAFLTASQLIIEATSFGGVHTTAERRARWGGDAVGPGFVRLSAGIEDTEDLVADVTDALVT